MANILTEALFVGLITGIFGLIISTLFMLPSKKFSWKKYTFWPNVTMSFFVTGFLLHILFEYFGANRWYCKNGNACMNNL